MNPFNDASAQGFRDAVHNRECNIGAAPGPPSASPGRLVPIGLGYTSILREFR
jgi:hypothetical protein